MRIKDIDFTPNLIDINFIKGDTCFVVDHENKRLWVTHPTMSGLNENYKERFIAIGIQYHSGKEGEYIYALSTDYNYINGSNLNVSRILTWETLDYDTVMTIVQKHSLLYTLMTILDYENVNIPMDIAYRGYRGVKSNLIDEYIKAQEKLATIEAESYRENTLDKTKRFDKGQPQFDASNIKDALFKVFADLSDTKVKMFVTSIMGYGKMYDTRVLVPDTPIQGHWVEFDSDEPSEFPYIILMDFHKSVNSIYANSVEYIRLSEIIVNDMRVVVFPNDNVRDYFLHLLVRPWIGAYTSFDALLNIDQHTYTYTIGITRKELKKHNTEYRFSHYDTEKWVTIDDSITWKRLTGDTDGYIDLRDNNLEFQYNYDKLISLYKQSNTEEDSMLIAARDIREVFNKEFNIPNNKK